MDQLAQCMVPLESDGVGGTLRESDEVEGRPLMDDLIESEDAPDAGGGMVSRKEKRRLAKKAKRKQQRIKAAEELKKEEEALAKDPLCQRRLQEQVCQTTG